LRALPQHFQVIGAYCLDPAKHEAEGVGADLLHGPESRITILAPDVVVDALPGLEPSRGLVRYFLDRGVSVVSANKKLIAEGARTLERVAEQSGTLLRYAAAVGGSAPMIEAVRRQAHRGEIESITGILNGTCNYVLDRCAEGLSLEQAVVEAQAKGFAEADPSDDLVGADAARKLRILARHAFGKELIAVDMRPLNEANLAMARKQSRMDQVLRVVSQAWVDGGRLFGAVCLRALDPDDPLASVRDEWNRLVITRKDGTSAMVSGRGAGRWPTTEAVIADLLELRHRQQGAAARALKEIESSSLFGDR
jgi:homoserine dehydrogenase